MCRNSTTLSSALSVKKKPSAIGAAKCFPQRENLPKNAAVIAKPAAAAIDRRKRRTASTVRRLFFCLFYRHFSALPRRFAPFAASAALLYPLRPYPSFIFEETSFSVFRRYRQPYGLICTNFHGKDFQPHGFKRIRIFISADFSQKKVYTAYTKNDIFTRPPIRPRTRRSHLRHRHYGSNLPVLRAVRSCRCTLCSSV